MKTPQIKEHDMTGIKSMVGRRMTKRVKFMGEDLVINKLTVAEVLDIQKSVAAGGENSEDSGLLVLKQIIRSGVEGGSELDDYDFEQLPLDEISQLSEEIMKFSGVGKDQGKSK